MPTLVQINVALNKGSTGKITEGIALAAKSRGWECHIVHGERYQNPSAFNSIQVSSKLEERLHYAESLFFDRQGLGSRFATKRLIIKLKQIKPDVVHLHNIHGCYINYRILFEYLNAHNIPVIWTMHDCWSFTGHCAYFDRIGCEKWFTGCMICPQKGAFPKSIGFDRSSQNYALKKSLYAGKQNMLMVPVSEWLGDLVGRSFLKDVPRCIINNGIDLNIFKPTKSDIREKYGIGNKFIVLGVADGYGDRKGLNEFVELSNILGKDYQIIMVGVEESELSLIPSRIIAKTRTNSQQELVNLYSVADVYINPTYEDNFPTTNIEALACGTPIITYKTGGSPEAVDASTGIVVEQGDIKGLVEAIQQMKDYPISSVVCRQRAEECFNQDTCFANYVDKYESIIKNI